MTRIQAVGILTDMLTTVELAGITKHHTLVFRSNYAELTIFIRNKDITPEQIRALLKDLVPDGMTIETSTIVETSTNYVSYKLDY